LLFKQKANLHSVKMARKCVAMQTKTFENQRQENGIYRSSNACIWRQPQVTEIFNRWPQWLRSGL